MQKDVFLKGLNTQQKEAVLNTDGPILIIAGAGSGKTRTLTYKIAYLIKYRNVNPKNILALTFTNKAADEMKKRISQIIGEDAGVEMGTFHSVCAKILRINHKFIDKERNFIIIDDDDQKRIIKKILKQIGVDNKFKPTLFLNKISSFKNKLKYPKDLKEEFSLMNDELEKLFFSIYEAYELELKNQNMLDFDDLIAKTYLLFKKENEILEKYQDKFKYILVDEYQDTNYAQYQLIKLLAQKHRNICVVGDVDQSIYSFRDADYTNILNFENDYSDAKIFLLEQNYRSTKNIILAANEVIKRNKKRKEKNLFTENEEGEKIKVIMAKDERKEAEFIAKKIQDMTKKGVKEYADFTILVRTNSQTRAIEEELIRNRIPYKVIGGFKFYQRKEIKDLIAYIRYIHNNSDMVSFQRIVNTPPRKIGPKTVSKFLEQGEKNKNLDQFFEIIDKLKKSLQKINLSNFIKSVIEKSGLKEFYEKQPDGKNKIENMLELSTLAKDYEFKENGLEEFLQDIALMSDQDEVTDKNYVHIMTIHSAKGLEFNTVFITGMEEGIFPHERSKNSEEELEEERRLCYVALTRAEKELYLLFTEKRQIFGKTETNPPSRFLYEIPEKLVEFSQYPEFEAVFKYRDELDDNIVDFEY